MKTVDFGCTDIVLESAKHNTDLPLPHISSSKATEVFLLSYGISNRSFSLVALSEGIKSSLYKRQITRDYCYERNVINMAIWEYERYLAEEKKRVEELQEIFDRIDQEILERLEKEAA